MTNYNSFRSQLTTDTAYNTTTETGAVLSDDGSALDIDTQLSQLLTTPFASSGPVQSLADVGITVQSDGTLSFNQNQFHSAWDANPTAVQQMFTAAKTGVSAQFDTLINQLAGQTNSLLSARATALQTEISDNQATITQMNQRLSDEQNLLYTAVLQHGPHDRQAEEHPERDQHDHRHCSRFRRQLPQQRLTQPAAKSKVRLVSSDRRLRTSDA